MKCWICDITISDCVLLPDPSSPREVLNIDSVADNTHPDTFEYKEVSPFRFIYYYLCINCCDNYLKFYPRNIKKLMNREITGKFHNRISQL